MVRTSAVDYKPKFATPRQLVCSSPESRLSRSAYALATAQCRLLGSAHWVLHPALELPVQAFDGVGGPQGLPLLRRISRPRAER